MTKGQFALLTAALGLVTMGGAGYFAYASTGTHSSNSNGASAAGQPTGAGGALQPTDGTTATSDSGNGNGNGNGNGSGDGRNCQNGDVSVTEQSGGGAAGHVSLLLVFQNTGSSTCVLHGYPGAELTGGTTDLNATRTLSGHMGGAVGLSKAPIVLLAPGADASAVLEWSDVPTSSGCELQNATSLLVTPPNTTQTTTLSIGSGAVVCSEFQVHPVLKGVVSEPASAQ